MDERIGSHHYAVGRPAERPRRARSEKARDPYDGLRPWSAITHGVGAVLAVLGTVLLLQRVLERNGGAAAFAAFLLYGLSMIGLYTASTLYHCLYTGVRGRIALRKYDHISIYFLIAGSYTPICALMLPQDGGIPMLAAIWTAALAGTVLSVAWISAPRWLTSAIYLLMGWMALFLLPSLLRHNEGSSCGLLSACSGWCWAGSSIPWAASSTPSNGRGGTTPALAATRFSTSLSSWAASPTSS